MNSMGGGGGGEGAHGVRVSNHCHVKAVKLLCNRTSGVFSTLFFLCETGVVG